MHGLVGGAAPSTQREQAIGLKLGCLYGSRWIAVVLDPRHTVLNVDGESGLDRPTVHLAQGAAPEPPLEALPARISVGFVSQYAHNGAQRDQLGRVWQVLQPENPFFMKKADRPFQPFDRRVGPRPIIIQRHPEHVPPLA